MISEALNETPGGLPGRQHPHQGERTESMNRKRPSMILIMDGFGINPQVSGNAIAQADTPHLDRIFEQYPMTTIDALCADYGLETDPEYREIWKEILTEKKAKYNEENP